MFAPGRKTALWYETLEKQRYENEARVAVAENKNRLTVLWATARGLNILIPLIGTLQPTKCLLYLGEFNDRAGSCPFLVQHLANLRHQLNSKRIGEEISQGDVGSEKRVSMLNYVTLMEFPAVRIMVPEWIYEKIKKVNYIFCNLK